MNAFDLTKADLINGLEKAAEQNIDGKAYGQGMLWNLLQYYRSIGRTEEDIRGEFAYALDNLSDDEVFHVSRN